MSLYRVTLQPNYHEYCGCTLLFNPFGDVDVVICPFVNLVKINWLNRTHILGPSLHCSQWFVMQAATPGSHVIQDGHGVNMVYCENLEMRIVQIPSVH